MKLIIKIGGSVFYNGNDVNVPLIQKYVHVIRRLREDGHHVGIVVGGGKPARKLGKAAHQLGANAGYRDFIGINAARQNARVLISALPEAYPLPPKDYQELISVSANHPLVIVGGFQPAQSTNAVASIFAEHINADFLFNLSNVKQVYDKDPATNEDAKPLDLLNYEEFTSIVIQNEQSPGKYALFDIVGLSIVQRSAIKLVFLDGQSPKFIFDVLKGENKGTIIG